PVVRPADAAHARRRAGQGLITACRRARLPPPLPAPPAGAQVRLVPRGRARMIRTLLLLGCVLGAAAGASEARALAVLGGPEVAAPTRTPHLASIGFERPALHRGSGGFAKKFGAAHAFKGKRLGHGRVVVRKAFAGQRFVPHRSFRTHAFLARKRSAGAGFVVADRFRKGIVIHGGRSNQLRLFRGTHSGHARVLARKHSFGPGFFAEQRFGHPSVVIGWGKRVIMVETGSAARTPSAASASGTA